MQIVFSSEVARQTPALGMSPLLDADLLLKSHLDAAQSFPVLHYPISIQSVPSDVSSAVSGEKAYVAAYEPRFLDAKWSPVEDGPHQRCACKQGGRAVSCSPSLHPPSAPFSPP